MARLALLLALALTAALVATFNAASTHASTTESQSNGFAGPVLSPPRAIDRDVEPASRSGLREVSCPAGGTLRCWVAGR